MGTKANQKLFTINIKGPARVLDDAGDTIDSVVEALRSQYPKAKIHAQTFDVNKHIQLVPTSFPKE